MNILTKELIDLKNRRKYGGGNPKTFKNDFEVFLNEMINSFALNTNGKINIDLLLASSKGKFGKVILEHLLDSCFDYDIKKLSQTQFLSAIYGLFQIIMQNDFFESEEEFLNKDIFEIKYERFKAQKLKKKLLVGKDKTDFFPRFWDHLK